MIFDRTDSYNLFDGEGTENHINMSRTSAYIFAHVNLKNKLYPQSKKLEYQTIDWIKKWSDFVLKNGNAEWNSSTYNSYNLIG